MKTEPKTHELKCWLAYFQAIIDGKKAFEYRYNDRDYQVGDVLHLREWHQNENRYTGRELKVEVTYALYGPNFGCAKDHAVLSIRPLPAPQPGGGGEAEDMECATCTLCSKVESSGFFTGCMIRDVPKDAHVDFNGWSCDGNGNLTRPAAQPTPPIALPVRAEAGTPRTDAMAESLWEIPNEEPNKRIQKAVAFARTLEHEAAALSRELEEAKAERDGLKQQIGWHEEANADHRRWVRHLDVLWNGEAGAAKQAALIDVLAQIERELPALRAAPRSETEGRDKALLDELERLASETECGVQVCCDNLTDPKKPAWWLEVEGQIVPVHLKEYAGNLRDAISAALAHDEKGAGE